MIALPAEDVEKSLFGLLSTGVIEYTGSVRRGRGPGATTEPARPLEPTPAPHGPAPSPPASAAPPPAPTSASHAAAPAAPAPPLPIPTAAPPAAPASSGNAAADRVAAEQRREIQDAWEGLRTRNHFEVLGLKRNVSEAEVKEAYFGLAKRFHPDVHHGSSLSDLHDQLEAVFIRLGEAYDVLRDPRRRTEYEERLGRTHPSRPATPRAGTAPVTTAGAGHDATGHASAGHDAEEDAELAEDAIRRAQKLFEKAAQREKGEDGDARAEAGGSEYWDAIQLLEPVVNKAQGRLRSRGEILLARCYLKNPRWSRRAEETLIAVTRRDPGAPDAWALLGGIYAAKGMQNRALNMYRKTLELRPEHEEAARYLAANGAVEDPPARPEEGGLLRRLFRKS